MCVSLIFHGHLLLSVHLPLLYVCSDVCYLLSTVLYVVAGVWGVCVRERNHVLLFV